MAIAFVLFSSLLLSCAPKAEAEGPTGPNPRLRTIELAVGKATMKAEVALSPAEREKGLMFRKSLPEGTGMLFVFETDQRLAFWMKNTQIPLSIAYISSDGTIRQILDLEPHSLEGRESERSVRYALEAPRGWFERAGAAVGDTIALPSPSELAALD
jgi:uncharacterized membrane protein (UPF0127 family)